MNIWWIAAIVSGVAALGLLGWSLARLAKALKEVRRSFETLAEITPIAQKVNGEADQWRSTLGQIRNN